MTAEEYSRAAMLRDILGQEYERHKVLRDNATSIEEKEYHTNIMCTLAEDMIEIMQPGIVYTIGPFVFVAFISVAALTLWITS